jgi:hypothetical protein
MGRHGWWNLWLLATPVALQIPSELNAPSVAPDVKVPAIFLMSGGDTMIPQSYQKAVHDAYGGPKTVVTIPNIDHNDGVPAEYEKQVREWIGELWEKTLNQPQMNTDGHR